MACFQQGLIAAQKCANIRQCSEKRAGSFAFAHSPAQLAQMVGFEPTEHVTAQTISSRSRYGHFDTSANLSLINFYYIRILEKMQVLFYKITKKCGRIRQKWAFSGKFVRNT
jgi:hypothetical protein